MNQDEVIELVRRIANDRDLQLKHGVQDCLLCVHRKSTAFALYEPGPDDRKAFREPEGKQRLIIYGLCSRCFELDGKADLAEAKIREKFRMVN